MSFKWEVKGIKELQSDLKKFSKDLTSTVTNEIDIALDKEVTKLKTTLKNIVNKQVAVDTRSANVRLPERLEVPKVRADVLKEVFDVDVMSSDYMQKALGNKVVNDRSNVFIYDKGRIKAWQSVDNSSSYASQESFFRNRLMEGVIIDAESGSISKINPNAVKGIKIECSRDTGQTIDSEKKFEEYKNSPEIERRKYDAPYERVAVWTMRQEDAAYLMKKSQPLDQIFSLIEDGDYDSAIKALNASNADGAYTKAIDRLTNIKNVQGTSNVRVHSKIVAAINSLKVRKTKTERSTTYTLFAGNFDGELDEQQEFMTVMRREINLWKLADEQLLIRLIERAIRKVIAKYSR